MVSLVFWRVPVSHFGTLWGLARLTDSGVCDPDLTELEIQLIAQPFFLFEQEERLGQEQKIPGTMALAGRPARSGRPEGRKWALKSLHFRQVL